MLLQKPGGLLKTAFFDRFQNPDAFPVALFRLLLIAVGAERSGLAHELADQRSEIPIPAGLHNQGVHFIVRFEGEDGILFSGRGLKFLFQSGDLRFRDFRESQFQRHQFQTDPALEQFIQRRIVGAVRSAARQKHAPLNRSVPLPAENEAEPALYAAADPEALLIGDEERSEFLARLRGALTPAEYGALLLYMEGLSIAEIAAREGRSAKSADNAVQRAKRKAAALFGQQKNGQ